jgi:hypothetical protein
MRLLYLVMGGIFVVAGGASWIGLVVGGVLLFFAWIAGRLPDHFFR